VQAAVKEVGVPEQPALVASAKLTATTVYVGVHSGVWRKRAHTAVSSQRRGRGESGSEAGVSGLEETKRVPVCAASVRV
jgi:hypothetical protein